MKAVTPICQLWFPKSLVQTEERGVQSVNQKAKRSVAFLALQASRRNYRPPKSDVLQQCHHEAGLGMEIVLTLPGPSRRHLEFLTRLAGLSNSRVRVKTMLEDVSSECCKELCVCLQESEPRRLHHAAEYGVDMDGLVVLPIRTEWC
jgi:hypothetical protein